MKEDLAPGAHHERTVLAWRRTALAVAVGALVALRLLVGELGSVAVAVCSLLLAWAAWLAWCGSRVPCRRPRGVLLAGTCALTTVVGAIGLSVVVRLTTT